MAIPLSKEYIIDNEETKFIGIKLPINRSDGKDGYFESTDLTFDAVKQNIRNLLNTRSGERVFQPTIGIGLDDFLFENIDNEMLIIINDKIRNVIGKWMPFLTIRNLNIDVSDDGNINKLLIDIEFFLNQNPNVLESIQVEVG